MYQYSLVLIAHTSGRLNDIDTVPFFGSSTRSVPEELIKTTSTGDERSYLPGLYKCHYGLYTCAIKFACKATHQNH